jgi:hypothetical protein
MWFNQIRTDLSVLPDMVDYYNQEITDAGHETKISGSLERSAQDLPGIVGHRYTQLQELEAILKYLNTKYDKMRSDHYRRYNERYNRELSDRSIEKYIDGEQDIVYMIDIINEVALLRNKYLGITKSLEMKSYMLGHITKLRVAGMNDALL